MKNKEKDEPKHMTSMNSDPGGGGGGGEEKIYIIVK